MNHKYPNSRILVETDWLLNNLSKPDLIIVDCDSPNSYIKSHIPNTVNVGTNTYLKSSLTPKYVLNKNEIEQFMGTLGINNDSTVICYDSNNSLTATRLWWVLNYYGHTKVKVLNGGWTKWFHEKKPTSIDIFQNNPQKFIAKPNKSLIAKYKRIQKAINNPNDIIWDTRSIDEYTGKNDRGNKFRGHVPSCIHIEWLDLIDKYNMSCFKSPKELENIFLSNGITRDKNIFSY